MFHSRAALFRLIQNKDVGFICLSSIGNKLSHSNFKVQIYVISEGSYANDPALKARKSHHKHHVKKNY